MSSMFMISALLSFFGGVLAIVVNVLRSFMEVYATAPKLGDALHFIFGLDAYAVILAFLSRLTARPSQAA